MLSEAISILALEVEQLSGSKPGSTQWHLQQAKSLGLSMLKKCERMGIESPEGVNMVRKAARVDLVTVEKEEFGG